MRGAKYVIVAGIVMIILGSIFNLQGRSMLGPETSFMYSNQDWTTHGIQIVIVGGIVFGAGVIMSVVKRG